MSGVRNRLADIYSRVPRIQCKGLCQECCGPVPATEAEVHLMERTAGRNHGYTLETLNCTFLNVTSGKCECYHNRPLICRVWGTVRELACPYGCQPDRWLTGLEVFRLMEMVDEIGGGTITPVAYNEGRLATGEELKAVSAKADAAMALGFRYPAQWDVEKPYLVCGTCQWRGQPEEHVLIDNLVGLVCPRYGDGTLRIAREGDRPLFMPGEGNTQTLLAKLIRRR